MSLDPEMTLVAFHSLLWRYWWIYWYGLFGYERPIWVLNL